MATLLDIVKKGSTDRSVTIRIIDSATGVPETGVEHNSTGIDLWYRREGAAKVSITEAALSALTDAHSDGGIEHIGNGEYRLDLPDAAFATGANHVDVGGTVTDMIVIGGRVRLVNYDPEDTVRLGLTALPNAAAEAAGGLYTRGTGAGQINQAANGQVDTNAVSWAGAATATNDVALATAPTNFAALAVESDGMVHADVKEIEGSDATNQIRDSVVDDSTRIDASALNTASAAVGSNGSGLTEAGGTGDQFTAIPWNAAWAAEVNAEVDTALADYDPPTRTELTSDVNSILSKLLKYVQLICRSDSAIATDNATELTAINANGGSGAGDYSNQTDSLEEAQAYHNDADTYLSDLNVRIPAALTGDGNMKVDVLAISGDITAANNAESFFDGNGYAGTNNVIPLVTTVTTTTTATNLTNAPTAGDLTATMKASVETAAEAALEDFIEAYQPSTFTGFGVGDPTLAKIAALIVLSVRNKIRVNKDDGKIYYSDSDNVEIMEAEVSDDGTEFIRTQLSDIP